MEEFNEYLLDTFMSNLNMSTLSKSDVRKMKMELQNLRKEKTKLVTLKNLTKPADLSPLISQAPITNEKARSQQTSKFATTKISQLDKKEETIATVSNYYKYFLFVFFISSCNKYFLFLFH